MLIEEIEQTNNTQVEITTNSLDIGASAEAKEGHSFISLMMFLASLYCIYQLFSVFSTIPQNSPFITILKTIIIAALPKILRIVLGYVTLTGLYYVKKVTIFLAIPRFLISVFIFIFAALGEDMFIYLKYLLNYLGIG